MKNEKKRERKSYSYASNRISTRRILPTFVAPAKANKLPYIKKCKSKAFFRPVAPKICYV